MVSMARARPVEILLVEDNPGDVRLTQRAFANSEAHNRLNVVNDGEDALAFMRRSGAHADAARPDLVLLDLNLPRVSGTQVLEQMRADPKLARIPVVVLTSSGSHEDLVEAYGRGANCYVTKPVDLTQFLDVIATIERFWLQIASLPPE